MRSPRSLGVPGRASVARKPFCLVIPKSRPGFTTPIFRFFETTGLAILTMLIQHYKVEPHPKFAGESFEQLKERYSQNILMVTLM